MFVNPYILCPFVFHSQNKNIRKSPKTQNTLKTLKKNHIYVTSSLFKPKTTLPPPPPPPPPKKKKKHIKKQTQEHRINLIQLHEGPPVEF
jgi:hypothetical protein